MPKGMDEITKPIEHVSKPEKVVWKEKFYKVRFHGKAMPTDSDDVILSVNGETLTIQRDKPVILPERFLECAEHTKRQTFQQKPGEPRKVSSPVTLFPFEKMENNKEYTEQDYRTQKEAGTEEHKKNLARYGYDVDPDRMR